MLKGAHHSTATTATGATAAGATKTGATGATAAGAKKTGATVTGLHEKISTICSEMQGHLRVHRERATCVVSDC